MDTYVINAESRETGKGAARSIRRSGNVPCVLYGHGEGSVSFQMSHLEMRKLAFGSGMHRVEVRVGKKKYDCVLKNVDYHPVTDEPMHADFQVLRKGEKIQITVPLRLVGQPKGVIDGGDLQHLAHDLEVLVLPKDIPDHLEVEVTELEIGDTIHVSDLSFDNVEIVSPPQRSVVAVTAKRIVEEEAEELEEVEGEEGLEEGEGAEEAAETKSGAGDE
jgi:large subunit ribosomal protein L25